LLVTRHNYLPVEVAHSPLDSTGGDWSYLCECLAKMYACCGEVFVVEGEAKVARELAEKQGPNSYTTLTDATILNSSKYLFGLVIEQNFHARN